MKQSRNHAVEHASICVTSVSVFYLYDECAHMHIHCCTFISPSAMAHLLRIASKHGVYGFDPLEQVGWDHIGGSAK